MYHKEQQAWAQDSLWLLTGHLWFGHPVLTCLIWEMEMDITYLVACRGDETMGQKSFVSAKPTSMHIITSC